jgi:hypothetical protein
MYLLNKVLLKMNQQGIFKRFGSSSCNQNYTLSQLGKKNLLNNPRFPGLKFRGCLKRTSTMCPKFLFRKQWQLSCLRKFHLYLVSRECPNQ